MVSAQSITITSPSAGNTLNACTYTNLTWSSTGAISNVYVGYSLDKGQTWNDSYVNNTGSYPLLIPSGASANGFQVKVRSSSDNSIFSTVGGISISTGGYSKLNFTNTLNLSYAALSAFYVYWNGSQTLCVKNVKIELSTNGGVNFPITISGNTTNSTGYAYVSLPDVTSSNTVVKVSDLYNPANFALSSSSRGAIFIYYHTIGRRSS